MAEIKVGCSDWLHADWAAGFYPEDLPSDWQLDYYSNEFSSLLITSKEQLSDDFCAVLDECLSEDFRLFISPSDLCSEIQAEITLAERKENSEYSPIDAIAITCLDEFVAIADFPGLFTAQKVIARKVTAKKVIAKKISPENILEEKDHISIREPIYLFQSNSLIAPKALRALAEYLLDKTSDAASEIYLFFANDKHSVENCRNLQLLSQML